MTQRLMRMMQILFPFCIFLSVAAAQEKSQEAKGVQGAFVRQSTEIEQQFLKLVDAVPQDKYSWRPSEGVRSVAESFLHVAGGNYLVTMVMGGKLPEGTNPRTLETSTTDKKKISEEIRKSFAVVNAYIAAIPDSDLSRQVNFFGRNLSVLDMIMLAAGHQHETLGQSIAYSRTNGVTPPWTAERQARMQQQEKKN